MTETVCPTNNIAGAIMVVLVARSMTPIDQKLTGFDRSIRSCVHARQAFLALRQQSDRIRLPFSGVKELVSSQGSHTGGPCASTPIDLPKQPQNQRWSQPGRRQRPVRMRYAFCGNSSNCFLIQKDSHSVN